MSGHRGAMEATGGCYPRQRERVTRTLEMAVSQASTRQGARLRGDGLARWSAVPRLCVRGGMSLAGTEAAGSTNQSSLAGGLPSLRLLPCGTLFRARATAHSSAPRATSCTLERPPRSSHAVRFVRTGALASAGAVPMAAAVGRGVGSGSPLKCNYLVQLCKLARSCKHGSWCAQVTCVGAAVWPPREVTRPTSIAHILVRVRQPDLRWSVGLRAMLRRLTLTLEA